MKVNLRLFDDQVWKINGGVAAKPGPAPDPAVTPHSLRHASNGADPLNLDSIGAVKKEDFDLYKADNVSVKDYGAVGDGVTDDTAAFAAALLTGKRVLIPYTSDYYKITDTLYPINDVIGIGLPKIKIVGGNGEGTHALFEINDYSGGSLEISGLYLEGNYDGVGTNGEWDHLVRIGDSKNVHIHHNYITNPYGDCVYIGSVEPDGADYGVCEDIFIYHNKLINPRRCCVAIVSGKNIHINDNTMTDPYPYVSCIDIEPNENATEYVNDVWIEGNYFSSAIYFVNTICPNVGRPNERIKIKNNIGSATYLFRSSSSAAEVTKDVEIEENTFLPTVAAGRFITTGKVVDGLIIKNNTDLSIADNGWNIVGVTAPIIEGNLISADRSIGMILDKCSKAQIKNNTFKNVYSSSGAISITASDTVAQEGHIITGNTFINSDYAIKFAGAVYTDVLIDQNYIDSARRAVDIASTCDGSDIHIFPGNIYTGAGTPVTGQAYLLKAYSIEQSGMTITFASAMPTTGSYKAGSIVINTGTSKDGNNMHVILWRRLTTGSNHIVNTDWFILYVSTVSPAI